MVVPILLTITAPLNPPTALTFAQANPNTLIAELTTDVTASATGGSGTLTYDYSSSSECLFQMLQEFSQD
jgi:hypothetical protein